MLLDEFERNIALAGTGWMNDGRLAILLHHLNRSLISSLIMLKQPQCHTLTPCRNQGVSSIWIMEDTAYFCSCANSCPILS